jgi:G6PDH family F420-dependent oxidoreductase
VEYAEIFDRPLEPPPIMVAAAGPSSAELAGSIGDGLISTAPQENIIKKFRASDSGAEKPCYGQMTVCWAESEAQARKTAMEWWPVTALPGALMSELSTPAQFEAAASLVTEDAVASNIVCGPDPQKHLEKIEAFGRAGFDHVYIHQVGSDQEGFFRFYRNEIFPELKKLGSAKNPAAEKGAM